MDDTTPPITRPGNQAARWLADRTVGSRIIALVATAGVVIGVFGVVAVRDLKEAGHVAEDLVVANAATGSALEADMMHDAIRADVLRAMLAGDDAEYDSAAADLRRVLRYSSFYAAASALLIAPFFAFAMLQ